MKCSRCNGEGVIHINRVDKNGYFNDAFFMKECPICGGRGVIEQTNEEWIHSMTTEDLVSFLYRVRFMSESPWQGKTISEWLKEKHNEMSSM